MWNQVSDWNPLTNMWEKLCLASSKWQACTSEPLDWNSGFAAKKFYTSPSILWIIQTIYQVIEKKIVQIFFLQIASFNGSDTKSIDQLLFIKR